MRNRSRILLAILIVAVVGGVVWLGLRQREPVYQGKRLGAWLENYHPLPFGASSANTTTTDEAVRQIGTNAIPTLLRLLQANDPPWKLKGLALLNKQRFIKINYLPAEMRQWQGMRGFFVLGPNGRDAVPALVKLLERNTSYSSRRCILAVLRKIGPPAKMAIPTLMNAMTNTDKVVRAELIYTLDQIHAAPELVVPVLRDSLNDKENLVRCGAADALGDFGAEAKPAVPALLELLKDQDSDVRANATNALKAIDPEAAAKAGVQ